MQCQRYRLPVAVVYVAFLFHSIFKQLWESVLQKHSPTLSLRQLHCCTYMELPRLRATSGNDAKLHVFDTDTRGDKGKPKSPTVPFSAKLTAYED